LPRGREIFGEYGWLSLPGSVFALRTSGTGEKT
jgi:hypothetical protein